MAILHYCDPCYLAPECLLLHLQIAISAVAAVRSSRPFFMSTLSSSITIGAMLQLVALCNAFVSAYPSGLC
jgi:hypothetical protein